MASQNLDAADLSVGQSMSSLGSDEAPKPKAEQAKPAQPRPYDGVPNMDAWESSMQRLTQMLKTLLQQLRSLSENTKIDNPTMMAAAGVVGSGVPLGESNIIGGMYNREKLYAPPPQGKERPSEPVREHIDLSVYFNRLASQMEALTQALTPYADAPIANRTGSPAGQQMLIRAEAQVDDGEGVCLVKRATVSFPNDRSSPQPSYSPRGVKGAGHVDSPTMAALVESVNQFTNHMTKVQELFRLAIGAIPVPKKRERLTIAEEEELRHCVSKLSDNMAKVASDLKTTLDQHTPAPDDVEEDTEDW
ncbi:hypothetical protein MTO96_024246 [Rhipicephalus appendiculatus]